MTVLSQSFFTLMRRNFMTLPFFTTRHTQIIFLFLFINKFLTICLLFSTLQFVFSIAVLKLSLFYKRKTFLDTILLRWSLSPVRSYTSASNKMASTLSGSSRFTVCKRVIALSYCPESSEPLPASSGHIYWCCLFQLLP